MIVQLQKLKVTLSILKQVQWATLSQIEKFQCLGYIIKIIKGKSYRFVLIYDDKTFTLRQINYPKKIEIRTEANQIDFYVVLLSDLGTIQYKASDKNDAENCERILSDMKRNADEIGQIYY